MGGETKNNPHLLFFHFFKHVSVPSWDIEIDLTPSEKEMEEDTDVSVLYTQVAVMLLCTRSTSVSWKRRYATGQYSDSESDDDPVTEDLEGDDGFNRAASPEACVGVPVDESQSASGESTQHVTSPITPL